ncbi:MAG TPA: CDP-alcohol phosphatidyltransferase family protein [Gemmatimonadaceae bacterium]|jgi:CDP-diacylglycerol--glycerol-3-phosphate 3-phosphatidyltransferase|nr:CDP-alcohol phosphatidyltransferase family protein [Gemmatimonadaceae bacterium]
MNLPNGLTVGRIAATPLIAVLPFANSWGLRLVAFALFLMAAITDYIDGHLARSRKEETDLGRLLDPLADKLLLVGTFVPMYLLGRPEGTFPFITPLGAIGLAWWVLVIVIGREAFMTVFRQAAARRGVVIAAIGPAKWKTGFQLVWQGSAYFWFFAATLAASKDWNGGWWRAFALFNGTVGTLVMAAAVVLTVYSLVVYLRSFGRVFAVQR